MNADNIKRLRKLACEVNETGRGETCLLMIEACDELERLWRIEAAAVRVSTCDVADVFDALDELDDVLETNPCPTK